MFKTSTIEMDFQVNLTYLNENLVEGKL